MKRPISVLVLSIGCIAFGAIGLMVACLMTMATAAAQMPPQPGVDPNDPFMLLLRENQTYRLISLTLGLLGSLTSVALLGGGIGLITRQAWARWLVIGWSGVRLLRIVVEIALYAVIFVPFMTTHMPPPSGPNMDMEAFTLGMQGCCTCMGLTTAIFPAAALIILLRRPAADWFRGTEPEQVEPWNA